MPDYFSTCLICSSDRLSPKKNYEKDYLVQCQKCDFVFSSRKPTLQELNEAYKGYSRDGVISPITIKRYHQLLAEFEPYRKTNNIIDVGAGDGWFLAEAKKRGWNVYGTEFEERAVLNCRSRGITMHQGILNPANYNVQFDIITSFEVIEHINNPVEEVQNFNQLLRSGGLIYVTTPNFNSLSRILLGPKWNILHYPEHLSYYTLGTLRTLFKKCGFQYQKGSTTGFSLSRFSGSRNQAAISGEVYKHNADEKLRETFESSKTMGYVKDILNTCLNLARKGDAIKSYFIKP